MLGTTVSIDEVRRLEALCRLEILDTPPEAAFDSLVLVAAQICRAPIALISLIDADRQWFKARTGLDVAETPREHAFCAHAILAPQQVMLVEDAALDPRFSANPLVLGEPRIRFYAGAPIVSSDGQALGTICAIDRCPRTLDSKEIAALESLGRLVRVLLEHRLLTRREAAMEEQRVELERFVALASDGLSLKAFVDPELVVRGASDTFLRYWAKRREDVIGRPFVEVTGIGASVSTVESEIRRALAGETIKYSTTAEYPGCGRRHVEVALVPARGKSGLVIGAILRAHDVTELVERGERLKATAEQLAQQILTQQGFVQMLSHDLREPINTIVNFASALHEDHGPTMSPEARDFVGRVLGAGKRTRALLDGLVSLIRLDNVDWRPEPVDLARVLGDVTIDLADAIQRTGAKVEAESLFVVSGEPTLLRSLLQNLVANAIKFARPGIAPRVDVKGQVAAEGMELQVVDNGIGIDHDQLEKVFGVFYRIYSRKRYEGSGLGLAICQKIADLHRARIWASAAEGGGLRVHVLFPRRPS